MTCECTGKTAPFKCPVWDKEMNEFEACICRSEPLIVDGQPQEYDRELYVKTWQDAQRREESEDPAVLKSQFACRSLGDQVGEVLCSCGGGRKPTDLFNCSEHGTCTLRRAANKRIKSCADCGEYRASGRRLHRTADRIEILPERPHITLGCAVSPGEEYSAVWATFNSIMTYHAELSDAFEVEFLVICPDDPPVMKGDRDESRSATIKRWIESKPRKRGKPIGRFVSYDGPLGTAQPRNAVFEHARGDVVFCFDPHVLFEPGAILAAYVHLMNVDCRDLVVGPQIDDSGAVNAYQREVWASGNLGIWTGDREGFVREGVTTPVFQQGLGAFAARREHWVKFHPDFREFGGCETYVCEKTRQRGGQVMCVPGFGWRHRFQNPAGLKDRRSAEQKLRNYLIGFYELGRTDWVDQCLKHYVENQKMDPSLVEAIHQIVESEYPLTSTSGKSGAPNSSGESLRLVVPAALQSVVPNGSAPTK